MPSFEEKVNFIERYSYEIKPLLASGEEDAMTKDEVEADLLLEKYRNKLYYHELPSGTGKKRLLFSANDPGAYNAIKPLIIDLENDSRCSGVGVLASGIARKNLESELSDQFLEVPGRGLTLAQDILQFSEEKPFDCVIGTVSSFNGPEGLLLFGGKSYVGAKKVFLLVEGWGSLGSKFSAGNESRMEIDAIFCVDENEKKYLLRTLPQISEDLIKVVGSPVIDSLKVEDPVTFTKNARKKLELKENTLAVLYLGGISEEFNKSYGADTSVNETTSAQTLHAMIALAQQYPEQEYALLVRPHPRDPKKSSFSSLVETTYLPDNLKVISASTADISMQDARYASDAVVSIVSTENFLVPFLGRESIFLGFEYGNLGGKVIKECFSREWLEDIISARENIKLATSPEKLIEILNGCKRAPDDIKKLPLFTEPSSVEKIKEILLTDSQ